MFGKKFLLKTQFSVKIQIKKKSKYLIKLENQNGTKIHVKNRVGGKLLNFKKNRSFCLKSKLLKFKIFVKKNIKLC